MSNQQKSQDIQAIKDALALQMPNPTVARASRALINLEEQLEALRKELERIAIDPARALSLYERGIVLNPARRPECEHDWDVVSVHHGPPGGSAETLMCRKCGCFAERSPASEPCAWCGSSRHDTEYHASGGESIARDEQNQDSEHAR